jgi:hypothetical protein
VRVREASHALIVERCMTQACDCAVSKHSAQNRLASLLTRLEVTPTATGQSRARVRGVNRLIASVSSSMLITDVTAIGTEG